MALLDEAVAQAAALRKVDHRPWPLPQGSWVMGQTWRELLFAHWRVDYDALRPLVPAKLELEQFDGSAWIGLTPFELTGLRLRGLPPAPGVSRSLELNCRTYVRRADRPGIWFFSLEASNRFFVEAARLTYRLPYRHARMTFDGSFVARRDAMLFEATYAPEGPVEQARPGSLEYFLTERYCLYADDGRARADIHHPPWPLQRADAQVSVEALAPVPLDGEPLCHFSLRQDVVVWPLVRL